MNEADASRSDAEDEVASDFIRDAIREDLADGRYSGVMTRFPPEPNGHLHIGHAKAICLNFWVAEEFGGVCNLRFDDTDPAKEEARYVDGIQRDIRWLGFDWEDRLYFASDYFEQLYEFAVKLIKKRKAYVCDLNTAATRTYRGSVTSPGRESPYRNRSIDENLDLFARMRAGEFPDGTRTLRAKIDMASPNMNMRDPVMFRILRASHYRRGNAWCIYPMYDFTHGQSDAIEGVSHSLCSQEFEDHRPLYDWYIRELGIFPSRQIEFPKLFVTHTVVGKRHLRPLIEKGLLAGWDDPRLITLSGLRRRGVPPEAIRNFIRRVGMSKRDTTAEIDLLEFHIRDYLNQHAPRVMGVIDPLKVIIENYPEDLEETFEAQINPEDPSAGTRAVPFSREVYIEREDFMEDPPGKFRRLAPGREVRLRAACYITCTDVVKDEDGNVVELRCTFDPESRGGSTPDGRKVRGTIHWVSAAHAVEAEVRLYDRLFNVENPMDVAEGGDISETVNPKSLEVRPSCFVESTVKDAEPGAQFQFERLGYFCVDPDSTPDKLVFNRTMTLRDTWARMQKRGKPPRARRGG
ncbi:MAG: glutamine--tRNA ligase/YqeY domain fusion protein [Gemmatimonadota bacterium]|nr:glutamine--tRNA ligase/YqeY domain fusion protein [Gemmatimonadota bacterium]